MPKAPRQPTILDILARQFPEHDATYLRALVICRQVTIGGETCTDPKQTFPAHSIATLVFPKYVSRGGLKLEYALRVWEFDPTGLVMLDAGSSTGGFTDCLLQHGALAVHAVDVGYNQLDYRLRSDDRVHVHERKNIMHVTELEPRPDAAVADLSFRSITGAARHILSLTIRGRMISLIKPQFEIPKGSAGFSGIVDDPHMLRRILVDVFGQLASEGVGVVDLIESPILGRKGNREFLASLQLGEALVETDFTKKLDLLLDCDPTVCPLPGSPRP